MKRKTLNDLLHNNNDSNPIVEKKKVAVIYTRYSSGSQREESIEDQERICMEYANANGITVIHTYKDYAHTGTNDNRPDFQNMIFDAKKGAFNMVLVYKIDRFSRNQYDHVMYSEQLRRNGVEITSVTEHITNDSAGNIMRAIFQAMSENYSKQLSENVRRGCHGNALKCKSNGGTMTYGYKVNPETRKFEIDPETAPIVKEVFERAANGEPPKKIIEWLATLGKKLSYNGLYKMFANERYIGTYTYSDMKVPNGMPRIIDDATFERVRALAASRSKNHCNNPKDYLLSGKLTCGLCGKRMNGEYCFNKQKIKYTYYCCAGSRKHTCKMGRIEAKPLECSVLEALTTILSTPEMVKELTSAILDAQKMDSDTIAVNNYEKQLKDVRKRKANILKAIEMGIVDSDLTARLQELKASEADIQEKIVKAKLLTAYFDAGEVEEYLKQLSNIVAEDKELQRDLIDILVTEIVVTHDKITCVYDLRGDKCSTVEIKKVLEPSQVEGVRTHELWWSLVKNFRIYSIPHKIIFAIDRPIQKAAVNS